MENFYLAINQSDCYPVDSPSVTTVFFIYYLAVIVAAIPANAFSLYVSWQHIKQKNDLGVYLFNLALNDLILTVGLCLWLDFQWRGAWVHGGYLCLLSVYCLFTNFYTSEALLCCIALNRYLAVVFPLKYAGLRKVGSAAAITGAIWVLVTCFNAATITWEDTYRESKTFSMCFLFFLLMSENMDHVNILRFFFGFILPAIIVFSFTWRTCLAVKSNQATKVEERIRISKLLTLVLLCILLCIGPAHVMMLFTTLFHDCSHYRWLSFGTRVSVAVASLNCLADPLIYCFITRTGLANVKQVVVFFLRGKTSHETSVV